MRLINADALMEKANSDGAYGYVDAKQISEAPTVDAILVVRRRECKHRRKSICGDGYQCCNEYYGMASGVALKDDDFCSYGERKGCAG